MVRDMEGQGRGGLLLQHYYSAWVGGSWRREEGCTYSGRLERWAVTSSVCGMAQVAVTGAALSVRDAS